MNDGLGVWLRRTRESRQLVLEDVERELKIRRRYLQALEMADYAALPGEIQARGFLRNYARFLGLPVDEALERYDSEIQGRPAQPRARAKKVEVARQHIVDRPSVFAPPPSEAEEAASAASGFPVEQLMTVMVILFVLLVAVFVGTFLWLQFGVSNDTPVITAPVHEESSSLSNARDADATPLADEPVFLASADGTVDVRLVSEEHVWVSMATDERIIFQDIAEPGQTLEVTSHSKVIVATGNGGAFQLYINGTDWGALGDQGQAVRRIWSPEGEVATEGP